jgi:hypothetical protein
MRSEIRIFVLLPLLLLTCSLLRSQTVAGDAGFILKGAVKLNGKPAEGVALELKKNGRSLRKITTTHNGKYTLRMSVDDSDKTCEYILSITRDGVVPKTLSINTYVPRSDFQANPFSAYDFDLEIDLIPTTVSDVIIEFPFGKIRWYTDQGAFALDQVYAKMVKKEETKLKEDPDKYLKELAEKRNKEEANKRLEEENRAKREAEQATKQKVEEVATHAPSPVSTPPPAETPPSKVPETEVKSPAAIPAKTVNKIVETPGSRDASLERFRQMTDPAKIAQVAEARKKSTAEQIKSEKKKSANLSSKYESNNPMTSLLDAADESNRHTQTPPKR